MANRIVGLELPFHLSVFNRHWSPVSEAFTGCDKLFTMLDQGWRVKDDVVYREDFFLSASRRTTVYYFPLISRNELTYMPVINSPHVLNTIARLHLRVLHLGERASMDKAVRPNQRRLQEVRTTRRDVASASR